MVGIDTETALLAALVSGPGYGLDLIERVRERTGGALELSQGSVYPVLRAMEREGLLDSYESDPLPERGGRARRYYKLTAAGIRAARQDRKVAIGLFGLQLPGAAR